MQAPLIIPTDDEYKKVDSDTGLLDINELQHGAHRTRPIVGIFGIIPFEKGLALLSYSRNRGVTQVYWFRSIVPITNPHIMDISPNVDKHELEYTKELTADDNFGKRFQLNQLVQSVGGGKKNTRKNSRRKNSRRKNTRRRR